MELIKYENNELMIAPEASLLLANLEKQKKEIEAQEEAIRTKLREAMEQYSVKKIDTPDVTITYVEGTDKEYFDKKKFQKDHPKMYDNYISMKPSASYVSIKLK